MIFDITFCTNTVWNNFVSGPSIWFESLVHKAHVYIAIVRSRSLVVPTVGYVEIKLLLGKDICLIIVANTGDSLHKSVINVDHLYSSVRSVS